MDVESRDVESLGKRIRLFFRELFGSRVTEHLETELLRLRQDFELRLIEKDHVIASLKEEKALLTSKITVYEMTLMPHSSRAGAEVVAYNKPKKPSFDFSSVAPVKSRWEQYQEEYYKAEDEKEKRETAEKAKNKEAAATAKG